jgi:alpha-D-ribose 1-methylphosphonate 5-triphosphate synthase subunit PhnH
MAGTQVIEGGFADAVLAGQRAFKAVMDALARPGTVQQLPGEASPPAPMPQGLAEIALTLCDHDSPLWLDAGLAAEAAVADWLRFHTGAPITADAGAADFAFAASGLPGLDGFARGSDEYPDRSTTIVLAVPALEGGPALTLRGPGIKEKAVIAPTGLPEDFVAQWAENRAQFPRGIDLLLVAPEGLIGLPRSTRIEHGGR